MKIQDIQTLLKAQAEKSNFMEGNTALKVAEPVIPLPNNHMAPAPNPATSIQHSQQQQALKAFIRENLREGTDYGQIPGVKNNVLFKPGAAKIIKFLKLRPEIQLLHTVFDPETKAISYTVKVRLVNERGLAATEALGGANSLEPKFAKAGMGSQNLVVSQAVKRATVSAVKTLIV